MRTITLSQLSWQTAEASVIFLPALCALVSLAAIGLEIAMGVLPSDYGVSLDYTGDYGGMHSPTVSFIFVRQLYSNPVAVLMLIFQ
jgi:hypothetical protein